jgi:hypothetical protein
MVISLLPEMLMLLVVLPPLLKCAEWRVIHSLNFLHCELESGGKWCNFVVFKTVNLSGQKGHSLKCKFLSTKLENPILHLAFKLNSAVLAESEG